MFFITNKEVASPPTHDQVLMAALLMRFYEVDAKKAQTPIEEVLLSKMRDSIMDKFLSAPKEVLVAA